MYRLILGCGAVGQTVTEALLERPGEVRVVTQAAGRVTALRDENVSAVEADPTDPTNYPERADVVAVVSDDPRVNRTAAARARERYPDAFIFAYAADRDSVSVVDAPSGEAGGGTTSPEMRPAETPPRLEDVADRVLDPVSAVSQRVLATVRGEAADRLYRLLRTLRSLDGRLIVVAHDNPDPDALASAVGLARLADRAGVPADAGYHGDISHQENRALVNLLDLPLRDLDDVDVREEYAGVALVDHSRPGVNDSLPGEIRPVIVIDHHPPREPIDADFIDLRADTGATSTLLAEYYERFGADPGETVATALLYGIRVDTRDFTREVSTADFSAAASLLDKADASTLERVESPSVSSEVFEVIARAVRRRDVRGTALSSCVGRITDRDALAQAAELLLGLKGIDTTLVYGYRDGTIYASGRNRGGDIDLGETLRDALGPIGSAGGHADMAGAQLPMGILADLDPADESLSDVIQAVVSERFFETLTEAPAAPSFLSGRPTDSLEE